MVRNIKTMAFPYCGKSFRVTNASSIDRPYTQTSAASVMRANASRLDAMIKRLKPTNVTSGDSTRK
jgi:hypothetical protein